MNIFMDISQGSQSSQSITVIHSVAEHTRIRSKKNSDSDSDSS